MESVFNLMLAVLSDIRELALRFKISAYGFDFTLWHFWMAILVVSIFLPLLFKFSSSSPFTQLFDHFYPSVSERIRKDREEDE